MPRELSEQEFNDIKAQVLASLPKTLTEEQFNRMAPSVLAGALATAEQSPEPLVGSSMRRAMSGFIQGLPNPVSMFLSMGSMPEQFKASLNAGMGMSDQYDQMRAAPTTSEKISHGLAMAVPGGPSIADAAYRGDAAGVVGQGAAALAPFGVAEAAAPVSRMAGRARAALTAPADIALEAAMKRLGLDPTQIDLQTARLRLQAARSRTRQAAAQADKPTPRAARANISAPKADKLADTPITPDMEAMADRIAGGADKPSPGNGTFREDVQIPPATSPAETPAAASPRRGRAPDAAAASRRLGAPAQTSALDQLQAEGLSAEEADQALRWHQSGVPAEQIVKRINATRALLGGKPELQHLPTTLEALREVRNR